MKTASVCRSCERRLLAYQHSSNSTRISSLPSRRFTSYAQRDTRAEPTLSSESTPSSNQRRPAASWDDVSEQTRSPEDSPGRHRTALRHASAVPGRAVPKWSQRRRSAPEMPESDQYDPPRYEPRPLKGLRNLQRPKGVNPFQSPSSSRPEPLPHHSDQGKARHKPPVGVALVKDDELDKIRTRKQWDLSRRFMDEQGTLTVNFRAEFYRWKLKHRQYPRFRDQRQHRLKPKDANWLCKFDREGMQNEWAKLDPAERIRAWPTIMVQTLNWQPEKAHQVLFATLDVRLPPYAIMDTLLVVASHLPRIHDYYKTPYWAGVAREVVELFAKVKETFPSFPFEQRTLYLASRRLPRDYFLEIFHSLNLPLDQLTTDTALHVARTILGQIGDAGRTKAKAHALEILEHLASRGDDVNTDRFRSVATLLFHQDPSENETESFDAKVAFSSLWDKGFRPNIINLTTYLDTARLLGDVEHALAVAKMFQDHGLSFDGQAVDILFRGVKEKADAGMVNEAIQLANNARVQIHGNLLHTILCFHAAEVRQWSRNSFQSDLRPFLPMLHIYAKRYKLDSLQQIIPESLPLMLAQPSKGFDTPTDNPSWDFEHSIVPVVDDFFSASNQEPTTQTDWKALATMFRAYIKSMQQPYELISLWMYFKLRLEEPLGKGNIAAELVKHNLSLIHDTFIFEMLKHRGLKRPALEVFGDMLHRLMTKTQLSHHPWPSVFTFTILLSRLGAHGEQVLANDLFQVMKENGVKPNLVTMNVRVKTAASAQDVERTVLALSELEAKFQPDPYTFRAFAFLRHQKQALEKIQRIIDEKQQQLSVESPGEDDFDDSQHLY